MHAVYRLAMLVCLLAVVALPAQAASDASTGAIRGKLSYPSHHIPPLRVYAINTETGDAFYVTTVLNQTMYVMAGLPPGTYHVLARPQDTPDYIAGYTAAVPCGLTADCTDHTLIQVTVAAGATTSGVDVMDWYAPPGTFPQEPDGSIPAPSSQLPSAGANAGITRWVTALIVALMTGGLSLRRLGRLSERSSRSG